MSDAKAEQEFTMPGSTAASEPVILDEPVTADNPEPEVKAEAAPVDSSPTSEENHDKKPKEDGFQKRINTVTARAYEQQRRADAAEAKIAEMEASTPQVIAELPETPQMPADLYDEDSMREYHTAMSKHSVAVAQAAAKSTFDEHQKTAVQSEAKKKQDQAVSSYAQNAQRDGVDLEKLRVAEAAVNEAGISAALGSYIMQDANGGKIVEHLYDNPSELHELLKLDPVSAGIKIANEIKPRALSSTPRVSNAPEPHAEITGGGGVVEKDDFERSNPGTTFI